LIKNSQPFGKKFQKTIGGDFFDSHCIVSTDWSRLNKISVANTDIDRSLPTGGSKTCAINHRTLAISIQTVRHRQGLALDPAQQLAS